MVKRLELRYMCERHKKELSRLGKEAEDAKGLLNALKAYRKELKERIYRVNRSRKIVKKNKP